MTRREFLQLKAKVQKAWRGRRGEEAEAFIEAARDRMAGREQEAFDSWTMATATFFLTMKACRAADFALLAALDKLTRPKRRRKGKT